MNALTDFSFARLSAAFASAFDQDNRILRLDLADDGQGLCKLLPQTVQGRIALDESYTLTVDCLCDDSHLPLKDLIGLPAEIGITTALGDEQILTGIVTQSAQLGSDGGFAKYRLTVEPALALLAQRRSSRVFQDKTVVEIVQQILDEHRAANPVIARSFNLELQLGQTYPTRSYCLQYRESDQTFIARLLREEGITTHYRFESGDHPTHTLVLFDDAYALNSASLPRVRFHRADGTESEDGLQSWNSTRQIVNSQTSLASYEYQAVSTHHSDDSTRIDQGTGGEQAHRSLEDYDAQTQYYGTPEDLARYTQLRQQASDRQAKTFTASGSVRGLNVGEWFTLCDHPVHDQDLPEQRQFVITGQTFTANNNLPGELQSGLASLLQVGLLTGLQTASTQEQAFTTDLTLVRRGIALTPDFAHTEHAKPMANGVQTATVVGPAGEEIHTDALGRIKIQFHWQRPSEHPEFGANLDDRSSCWLRIAYPSAGAGWGHQFIPRIGQEVLVDFIEGDIDRPLITGVVYNGSHTPPEFSGAGSLPANKTLSGIKSKEYKGGQYNELLFDDTTGEVRTKLSCEHAKTQLNLGYLTHPRTEGKGEPRGEGAELRTDAAASIRAAHGLLLSTDARSGASDNQLARGELINHLQTALALLKSLGDSAETCHAFKTETDKQKELNQQLTDWENGSNTAKGKPNGQSPIIALSSPGGISSATPKTTTHYTGEQLNQIAGQHIQQTAGQQIKLNAGSGISLFSQKEGVRLIAHEGQFLAQAQTDDMAINAQKGVAITSSTANVELHAEKAITAIGSGGAYLKLEGGNIEVGCPGAFTVKAGSHVWAGPASKSADQPMMPMQGPHWIGVHFNDAEGNPIVDAPYKIKFDSGATLSGKLNAQGEARHEGVKLEGAKVSYELPPPKPEEAPDDLSVMLGEADKSATGILK
ncbi:MAG: type VI secretion system Vgr family protein [Formivibrio sp.]|nr:type VI secretion system Vgr family protein [Formivibrio sp.]